MAAPLALLTADWHIRKFDRVWYRRGDLCGDTAWSVEQIAQIADEHDVPFVFLAGDLFEQKLQQSDALLVMRRVLDRFESQNRRVLYIQGQHERSVPPLLASFHRWPEHLDGKRIQLPGYNITVAGLDYCNPTDVERALRAMPDANILLTHQVWRDFMGEDRGDAWLHWLPKNIRTVVTGDFHATIEELFDNRYVISPGSICMQNIGEVPQKFVVILDDDMVTSRVPLRTRRYFDANIHNDGELEAFLDGWPSNPARQPQAGVPAEISRNLIRVCYRADLPEARLRIGAAVGTDAHLFLTSLPVDLQPAPVDVMRRQQAVLDGGLEGCINAFYRDNKHVHEDAVRLTRASNLSDELLHIFKERMTRGFDLSREGSLQDAVAGAS